MKPRLRLSKPRHITAYYEAVDSGQIRWGEPLPIKEGKYTHVIFPMNEHDQRQ